MENTPLNTVYIRDQIARCEDTTQLREQIFPLLHSQKVQWSAYIQKLIAEKGLTKTAFAQRCGVSRVTVDKWSKGAIPRNRETFLRIGLAANLTMEQMNQILMRYGRYPGLYSKSLEDCICIFALSHNEKQDALEQFNYIRGRVAEKLLPDSAAEQGNISTVKFDRRLSGVDSPDVLESFIVENISVFSFSYHRFYAYVKMFLSANDFGYAGNVSDLAETQGWSSSLRQCVSAINQGKWYPTRNKIISLGLHLCMDHDQVNEMLELAHMEPLCAKNIFESVIIFILEDVELNDILNPEEEGPDALCRYAKKVMEELNLPEIDSFLAEVSEIDDVW